jgi:hypothetical protein
MKIDNRTALIRVARAWHAVKTDRLQLPRKRQQAANKHR